jgi:hypothetical protein
MLNGDSVQSYLPGSADEATVLLSRLMLVDGKCSDIYHNYIICVSGRLKRVYKNRGFNNSGREVAGIF